MNLLEDLKILAEKYDIPLEDLKQQIGAEERKLYHNEIINESEKNKDLVGRCFVKKAKPKNLFPEMNKYYKVISYRSGNEYRVECLCFYEHPTYWFEYKASKIGRAGDYYLGEFDFESFKTDSFLAKDIRRYQEITIEEFNEAAKKFTEEMLEMTWHADHHRWGNVLPTDEKWTLHNLDELIKYEKEHQN